MKQMKQIAGLLVLSLLIGILFAGCGAEKDYKELIVGTWKCVQEVNSEGDRYELKDEDDAEYVTFWSDGTMVADDAIKWQIDDDRITVKTDDDNVFVYKILELNEDTMVLKLEFEDGYWVKTTCKKVD